MSKKPTSTKVLAKLPLKAGPKFAQPEGKAQPEQIKGGGRKAPSK